MRRIGLALSGGGFRATLFHLGMIRYLRDANVLSSVSHITSVSGGSILAAHLVLNWRRYTGTEQEFDAVAAELLRFVQLDIRNRVVRRYPLALPLRALRRLARLRPQRQLTRTGLLEYHYEKHLYGDTCLYQLPEQPRLYMLSTNLSEGCLCAFTREGLLMQRRQPGQRVRFEKIPAGLATVPMAVTASSAFPGFFPPFELGAEDVGADPGRFSRLAFTDGGVYDNLGVRMFRCLERSGLDRETRLHRDELCGADRVARSLAEAGQAAHDTPLRRLAQMVELSRPGSVSGTPSVGDPVDRMLEGLSDVMNHENLAREPAFAGLELAEPDAAALRKTAQCAERELDAGEQFWLNRQLVQEAFQQAAGHACFESRQGGFDAILISDAGKAFKIVPNARAGGMISTSMRASDILMDRVWQLEVDNFTGTPGFVFAPISRIVGSEEDSTAAHPEIQRGTIGIRTDLDRFSPLEISALVRHGYTVGRSALRGRPDLFGSDLPADAPWDPMGNALREPPPRANVSTPVPPVAATTRQSRDLHKSAVRRIWSSLFDYRDWISFVYVPLLVPILILGPYYVAKWRRQSQVAQQLTESIAHSNRDYAVMRKLLTDGPSPPFKGMPVDEIRELTPPDYSGFDVIADMRVFDFRPWKTATDIQPGEDSWAYGYRRIRVQKLEPTANQFSLLLRSKSPLWEIRSRSAQFPAVTHLLRSPSPGDGSSLHLFKVDFDLSKVPVKEVVDLAIDVVTRDPRPEDTNAVNLYVDTETGFLSYWMLMPDGKPYESYNLVRYAAGADSAPESVAPAHQLNTRDGKILAFALLGMKPGFNYECRWTYAP
jgi:predicted acylesterase/phospholipase RssA